MDKKVDFEQNIKDLEEVVRQLEGGNVSLDDLLKLFEKGVGLAKSCNAQLDGAEQKINMLIQNKTTGEMIETPFVGDDAHIIPSNEPPLPIEPPESNLQQAFMDVDSL